MSGASFASVACNISASVGKFRNSKQAVIAAPSAPCVGCSYGKTVDEFERVYGEPGDRYERELREIYNGLAAEGKVPLKPHTIELLSSMKNAGMKIAIASSSTREEVTSQMAALGALPYFDICVCGDQVTRSKPDPEIFLLACDALGVKPEEGVGLEDSFNGVRSCKASGLYTIMVPDIIQPDEEMKGLADIILPSLKDVQAFLNLKSEPVRDLPNENQT